MRRAPGASAHAVQPLIVFNPTDGPRTDVVTANLCLPEAPHGPEVIGPDGCMLPHQVVTEHMDEQDRLFFHHAAAPDEMGPYLSMVRGGRLLGNIVHQIRVRRTGKQADVVRTILARSWEIVTVKFVGRRDA